MASLDELLRKFYKNLYHYSNVGYSSDFMKGITFSFSYCYSYLNFLMKIDSEKPLPFLNRDKITALHFSILYNIVSLSEQNKKTCYDEGVVVGFKECLKIVEEFGI